ncbi:MAG: hypothetical protein ACREJC_23220 [Tepidisphaeraceae bacterium]
MFETLENRRMFCTVLGPNAAMTAGLANEATLEAQLEASPSIVKVASDSGNATGTGSTPTE